VFDYLSWEAAHERSPINDSRIPCTLSPAPAQLLLSVNNGKVFHGTEFVTNDTGLNSDSDILISEHDPAGEVIKHEVIIRRLSISDHKDE